MKVEFSNIHQAMKEFSSEKTKILDMLKEMDLCMSDARRELEKLTVARQVCNFVYLGVFSLNYLGLLLQRPSIFVLLV